MQPVKLPLYENVLPDSFVLLLTGSRQLNTKAAITTKSKYMLTNIINFLFGKVKTGFSRFTVAILLMKARNIYAGMLDNSNFSAPSPDMPTMLQAINTLQAAQDAAAEGGKAAKAARDEAKGNLIILLKALGNYVNYTAQGNIPILATSNFDLVKAKQPVVLQSITQLLVTSMPNTNSLSLRAIGGSGIRGFVHQYTTDPTMADDSWVSVNSTVRKYTFQNLVRGKEYIVRLICIGSNGQSSISDPVSRIVQ
ncbi:MAG TPA: fibronectin type III domain-containing protein [Ginsengibacter sp.]